jgi:hypothetical protein
MEPLILGPSPGEPMSGHHRVVRYPDPGVGRRIPVDGVAQVQEDRGVRRGRKGVAVEPDMGSGGELCVDVLVLQVHRVVPRGRLFPVMGETGTGITIPSVLVGSNQHHRLAHRHHQNVQKISDPGAAEMGVAEAHQETVLPIVTGDPVPSVLALIRTQLDHPPRDRGSRVDVPVPSGADSGVHPIGEAPQAILPLQPEGSVRWLAGCAAEESREEERKRILHVGMTPRLEMTPGREGSGALCSLPSRWGPGPVFLPGSIPPLRGRGSLSGGAVALGSH